MVNDEEVQARPAAVDKRKQLAQLLRQKASRLRSTHTPSRAQQELWLINKIDPETTTFHVGVAVRIVCEVDTAALRAACQQLIDRHVMLRSLYRSDDGEKASLEAHGAMEANFEQVDASHWDDNELAPAGPAAARRAV